jgi:hypothetical protein
MVSLRARFPTPAPPYPLERLVAYVRVGHICQLAIPEDELRSTLLPRTRVNKVSERAPRFARGSGRTRSSGRSSGCSSCRSGCNRVSHSLGGSNALEPLLLARRADQSVGLDARRAECHRPTDITVFVSGERLCRSTDRAGRSLLVRGIRDLAAAVHTRIGACSGGTRLYVLCRASDTACC